MGLGQLTTHVLDTNLGKPAAGLEVELWRLEPGPQHISTETTNGDGRLDKPLLSSEQMTRGIYELRFHVGSYFRNNGTIVPDPAFLNVIPIQFGISKPTEHYHVPLLVSAHGYTTYRGS
jgi:5-hydroxyisourate hydrolase